MAGHHDGEEAKNSLMHYVMGLLAAFTKNIKNDF
jgi:hypothetical protein